MNPRGTNYRAIDASLLVARLLGAFAIVGLLTLSAIASPISVANFSFEFPPVAAGSYAGDPLNPLAPPTDSAPPWSFVGSPNGVQNFSPSFPGTDGFNVLYVNGGGAYQDVGALQANTTYTLTVAAGNQSGFGAAGSTGQIYLINGTNSGGAVLNSTVLSDAALPINSLTDFSTAFTTGASVSGDLTIYLAKTGGNQVLFDNVRLEAVPEPSSVLLLGLGALGLFVVARRRRKV